jgi:hypothetical protein
MHINILIWVYTVVFAINFALSICTRMYSIPACIGINTRIMIRVYIVFYSALIFVCNSYYTRICMIRTFIWYAYLYDTHVRRWYTYSGIQLIMICVWYTRIIPVSYVKIYVSDTLLFHMQCSECGKWHFRASNFKNFPLTTPLAMRGLWKCYGQIFGWIRLWPF